METVGYTGISELNGKFAVYLDSELFLLCDTFGEALEAIKNETTEYSIDSLVDINVNEQAGV